MKRQHYITVILSLAALLLLPSTALAEKITKFKGNTADAYFNSFEGCIQTTVIVYASKDIAKQGGYESSATLYIGQYDTCAGGTPLLEAYGSTPLGESALQADKALNSATLVATLELFDYVANAPLTANVNLSWSGIGEISSGKSTSHWESPGCKFHSTSNGTFRAAQASGTVAYGDKSLVLADPKSAALQSLKSGTLTFGCEDEGE